MYVQAVFQLWGKTSKGKWKMVNFFTTFDEAWTNGLELSADFRVIRTESVRPISG